MIFAKLKYRHYIHNIGFRNRWKAVLILVIGLLLTFVSAISTGRIEVENQKKEFALVCNEIKTKISIRLHSYALLLRSGSSYYGSCDTVNRRDWKEFIEHIKISRNLPGVQGVGYSQIISGKQLQKHIQQIRGEGFPEYKIKPAGERDFYTSIIYIEPFSDRNLRAFGYDMFTETVRRKAMELSRDSDLAVLSGKVILVQETNQDVQFGTLMYVPVYRRGIAIATVEQRRMAIRGWVYSPYRMNDLMHGILGRWDFDKSDRIQLQVYDESISANSLLYNSQAKDSLNSSNSLSRTISLPINFNGKTWILNFTQLHEQFYFNSKVVIILAGGSLISLLLMALGLSLLNTLHKSQQLAGRSTHKLRESEQRFEILLNSTAEAIYGIDLQGNCTFTNKACIQMLGVTDSEQLLGKNMHDLIHYAHSDGSLMDVNDCLIFKAFIEGEGTHVDNEVLWRLDGTSFPAEYWSYPIFINGKIEGAVVTFFNSTEKKQFIEKINNARNEAEKANLAKSEFLSRMSHELRTPMNSILGFAQLLEMGSELSKQQETSVGHILNSGNHLLKLINEVLEISRIEAGHIELSSEPLLLNSVIREMIDSVEPLANARKMKLEYLKSAENQLCVKSDHQRLKQVLLNLLSNAIKYNKEGYPVIIKTETRPKTEDGIVNIRISIRDAGTGISPTDILRLFQPFERIGAEKTATEGTGLGLAVVKKLMDALGGTVGVESKHGKGSTFWIELPQSEIFIKSYVNLDSTPVQSHLGKSNMGRLLYIEDNDSNIELIEQILLSHRSNIRLISNSNGMQAVPLAIEFEPDLILLDLNLPDISGDQVVALLQAEDKTKLIPVVIISADAMPKRLEKLMKAGAKNYLTKPLDISVLLMEIDKWVTTGKR